MNITQITSFLTPETVALLCWNTFSICLLWLFSKKGDCYYRKMYWVITVVIGTVVLFIQFSQTFVDFDDFGYAALSYAEPSFDVVGRKYSLVNILQYLWEHYMTWGGRILYFFVEILLLRESEWFFRIAEVMIIVLWFCLISHRLSGQAKQNRIWAFAFMFVMYGLLEIEMMRDGVYWFTAAVIYVFPILPATWLIYKYSDSAKHTQANISIGMSVGYGAIAFISSFSQEQISAAVFGTTCLIAGYKLVKKKKLSSVDWAVLIGAGAGFLLLLFCPGSMQRDTLTQIPLFDRILNNLDLLDYILFGSPNIRLFMVAIIFAAGIIAFTTYTEKGKLKVIHLLFAVFSLIIGTCWIFGKSPVHYMNSLPLFAGLPGMVKILLRAVFLATCGLYYIRFCLKNDKISELLLSSAACIALTPGLISPGISMRMMVPFCLLLFPMVGGVFVNGVLQVATKRTFIPRLLTFVTTGCLVFLSAYNYQTILCGYAVNAPVRIENNKTFESAIGKENTDIYLKRLIDDRFANIQPYQEGYRFVEVDIREYYNLSESVGFIWE